MLTRLVIGRALSALATALIPTTLTLVVLRGSGDAADLGIVLACELVPMLVLLPFGGVVADRFPPERVVLLADLTRCAAQAAIGVELLLGVERIADLAVLAAVTGAAAAFGTPAVPRLVAATVEGAARLRANARIGLATSLSAVGAPAIAGALVLGAGPGWASLFTAVLFAASAFTLGGVRTARAAAPTGAHSLLSGWREIRRRPWFLVSVMGHGVWHLCAGLFLTLGPLLTVRSGEAMWVIIVQCGTVGMLAGVFAAPRLPIRRRPLVGCAVGASLYAAPLAALAVPLNGWAVAVAYAVAMFGLGLLVPLWETVVADRIPVEALGRVRSFDSLISFAARPLGLAVAAPLAGWAGTAPPLWIAAVAVAAASLSVLGVREVRSPAAQPLAAPRR
ncbi:MFS transporter [Nonomuraea dietziae]|uniref:MFS transporter n=1 Tax=Nonomuraea dietziae TaxID=65515 RepID=UPI0033C80046